MDADNLVNAYGRQLTPDDIAAGEHRAFVGGLWEEIGALQLDFLVRQGLAPHHHVLDVGCGALRCGIPIISYLEADHYCGLDMNASLIEAGCNELKAAGLEGKLPKLVVSDKFEVGAFGRRFDYAIAQSVFSHLPMNHVVRCLTETGKVLQPHGILLATFFEAPFPGHLPSIAHAPEGIVTNFDSDPYHYSFLEMQWLGKVAGMKASLVGEWGHPRGQRMLCFRPAG